MLVWDRRHRRTPRGKLMVLFVCVRYSCVWRLGFTTMMQFYVVIDHDLIKLRLDGYYLKYNIINQMIFAVNQKLDDLD
jgi:hypothetical protein